MSKILTRYLTKEVFIASIVVTFLLMLIFLSHQMVRFLSYAASGKLASNILLQLMGYEASYLFSLLLPLALFLGIIWVYGGLYANNELRVMQACGLSIKKLFLQTSVLAIFITTLVLFLMLWVNPYVAKEKYDLIERGKAANNVIDTILPGRFQVTNNGARVIYVERLSRDHRKADNIFIADQRLQVMSVVSAAQGYQASGLKPSDRFIVAENGNRYEGVPGQNDYKVTQFQNYKVRMPVVELNSKYQDEEMIPTLQLWSKYDNSANAAEFQWRLSVALSVLLLAALAIPLSQVKPRQGRYFQLFIGILIYLVYVNLLFISREWVSKKIIPIDIGMWWIHGALLLLIITLLVRRR